MATVDYTDGGGFLGPKRRNQQTSAPFDSGTGQNVIPPTQTTVPPPGGPRVDGRTFPGMPGNPPQAGLPSGVSQEQFDQLSQRAGGADAARAWLQSNPGDILRGLSTATFGSTAGGGGSQAQGQFTDPIAGSVEAQAASRRARLENPPQGSGMQRYESALGDVANQFREGGFTPAEMEIFQTQAIDPLEQLRTARKQQVMEQLARRGLNPQSGVAQSMIADVDRQFDALRSQQQRSIAGQAANERSSRMMQALQLLGGLAGSEEGRLDKAFTYGQVPLALDDRAFNRISQFYNTAGNPLALVNPLMNLGALQGNRQSGQQEALGLLAAILLNQ